MTKVVPSYFIPSLIVSLLCSCGGEQSPPAADSASVVSTPAAPAPAAGGLVPFDAYDLAPGESLALATWTASNQQIAHVEALGANVETTPVGNANLYADVRYTGPIADPQVDDPHATTVWPIGYQPFAAQTKPLLGGIYAVDVGCDGTAVRHCLFSFRAWTE